MGGEGDAFFFPSHYQKRNKQQQGLLFSREIIKTEKGEEKGRNTWCVYGHVYRGFADYITHERHG